MCLKLKQKRILIQKWVVNNMKIITNVNGKSAKEFEVITTFDNLLQKRKQDCIFFMRSNI